MSNIFNRDNQPKTEFANPQKPDFDECLRHFHEFLLYYNIFKKSEIGDISSYFDYYEVRKNDLILEQGEISKALKFIVKGSFIIYIDNDLAKSNIALLTDNNFCTAFKSFHFQVPSNYNIRFNEDAYGLLITHENYKRLLKDKPVFEKFSFLMLNDTIELLIKRTQFLQVLTATQRYNKLINNDAEIIQRFSLGDVANYLGIELATLSRIRHKYKNK